MISLYIFIYFIIFYIFLYTSIFIIYFYILHARRKEMRKSMDHPCYSRSENFSSRVSNRDLLNRDLAVVIPGFMRKREGEISHSLFPPFLFFQCEMIFMFVIFYDS